jgi:hypothetical protein
MTRVIYIDKSIGFVPILDIDGLITAGKIAAFCGPDGWVSLNHGLPCTLNDLSKQQEAWARKSSVHLNQAKPSSRSVTNCVLNRERVSVCGRIVCEWLCARE